MKAVAVFYATREGQARKVADRIAGALIARELEVAVHRVGDDESDAALGLADAAVLVASVHAGKHEREMIDFVQRHERVRRIPSSFVSVCVTEAIVESPATPERDRRAAIRHIGDQIHQFLDATHWTPAHILPVAGALMYTHYNFLVRFGMRKLAEKAGLPTDTSRDHELTDWGTLDEFAARLAHELTESADA